MHQVRIGGEMTPEDVEFVKRMNQILSVVPKRYLLRSEAKCLISLLIESEAMREKAEFYQQHVELPRLTDMILVCKTCITDADQIYRPDIRHSYATNAQWIAAKKKEWEI